MKEVRLWWEKLRMLYVFITDVSRAWRGQSLSTKIWEAVSPAFPVLSQRNPLIDMENPYQTESVGKPIFKWIFFPLCSSSSLK